MEVNKDVGRKEVKKEGGKEIRQEGWKEGGMVRNQEGGKEGSE